MKIEDLDINRHITSDIKAIDTVDISGAASDKPWKYMPLSTQTSYTHQLFQGTSLESLKMFFIDGILPEEGDQIIFIATKVKEAEGDQLASIEVNCKVVQK